MQLNNNSWLTIKGNIGPEIGFGHVVGQALEEPVLLVKSCIGNRGLGWDLLPPGSERYEVAGFVFWQGHKDQGEPYASRYEQNLVNLIKSLRKDFSVPNALFVIATGCGNPGTSGGGLKVAEAQLAVSGEKGKYPEFKGNVKTIDSRPFWPSAAESPTKAGYHYYGNAGTYMEVGLSLGQAMTDLLKK